ncbi:MULTISPECIES: hypothetical protein [unclassified Thioalkalivibrio]|uniref:hypothetical protein n=1 Tax=unclassified Thioalkalivibrio TaxID=2621013 RepID=UPI00036E465C|nr:MULTISPECIES: hypothetical protein [unclassified Thioalkalivibrio]
MTDYEQSLALTPGNRKRRQPFWAGAPVSAAALVAISITTASAQYGGGAGGSCGFDSMQSDYGGYGDFMTDYRGGNIRVNPGTEAPPDDGFQWSSPTNSFEWDGIDLSRPPYIHHTELAPQCRYDWDAWNGEYECWYATQWCDAWDEGYNELQLMTEFNRIVHIVVEDPTLSRMRFNYWVQEICPGRVSYMQQQFGLGTYNPDTGEFEG